ncbi:ABC transporter permease [Kitasatospora aureofaciens]|uniref:Transport permease protein n=1 Tax=Kitasatospora aureofaciens TaxID=1894 RepID=A0A1E7MYJ9_KITAU|nr:ABC transporter permease [Kitasatospora aureofaciens]QEV01868.1 ABC transporter permease [Streptomyces viridifaciens]ARF80618.1 ABC transporter [Kitasatospora aureofaciens]OEV33515.1 ABC transporter [Kitasatospora aureofaciens]UKZ08327.1 ABC transporter permease [Streptomyces viridifaciens]GGU60661.1 transport permease protein [Kitasatospora aureofaciens]
MTTATLTPARAGTGADDTRIGAAGTLRHIGALTRRNLMRIKADPESMFDAVLMPIVFTLLFVYVFGGAIAGGQDSYIQRLIPGLLGQTGMTLALAVGTGLNSDFQTGVMDRFRTLPIGRASVLLSKLAAESLRALLSSAILLGFAFVLGFEVKTGVLEVLATVGLSLVFGMSIVWISMLLGMALRSPQAVQGVSMLVLMPMQFGSSIFAPTDTMPGWLQTFTEVNPLSQLADASRALLNGEGAVAHPVMVVLIWSAVSTAIFAPLAVARFRKRT